MKKLLIDLCLLIGMVVFGWLCYKNVENNPDQFLFINNKSNYCEVQCNHEECQRQRELEHQSRFQVVKPICFALGSILCFCFFIGPKLDFSHCFIVVSFPMN